MTTAMSIFCLVISVYAVVSFVLPLKARLPVKIGLAVFFAVVWPKVHLLQHVWRQHVQSPIGPNCISYLGVSL